MLWVGRREARGVDKYDGRGHKLRRVVEHNLKSILEVGVLKIVDVSRGLVTLGIDDGRRSLGGAKVNLVNGGRCGLGGGLQDLAVD